MKKVKISNSNEAVAPKSKTTPKMGRIAVTALSPTTPDERWNPKAFETEVIAFRATVFREGHDQVGAILTVTAPSGVVTVQRMKPLAPGSDRWEALVQVNESGDWSWTVTGFDDEIGTWLHDAAVKIDAGVDVELMFTIGSILLQRGADDKTRARGVRTKLGALAAKLSDSKLAITTRRELLTDTLFAEFNERPLTRLTTSSEPKILHVERLRSGVGSWYEFFPRSEGATQLRDGSWKSGTFATAKKRVTEVADMGFDVIYLPPIHPIGITNRKGPNNTLTAGANDPGSPWAIGNTGTGESTGGHDDIHPDLGTLADFRAFVKHANDLGVEIALDLALQASPDHPWVRDHPEWFTTLPDGSIRYAENPPKKYQDIYPINFDNDPDGIFIEVLRVVNHWISQGVRIFRVDNPHTKPLAFWERLIATVNATHRDIIFLAEAFTRPALMQALALIGFQQSYSYFTWRNTKSELTEFLSSVAYETADFMRPNLFVNTPDILTDYLQRGGPSAFSIRATLAATAAPTWGVYAGFELFESVARTGVEEAIDNEKYEYKPRDFAAAEEAGESLAIYLGMLNEIRREHAALRQLRNIHFHHSDDASVLVYSKRLDARFTGSGKSDTIIVVINVEPHSLKETTVHLDLDALGVESPFTVSDLVTGDEWEWGEHNYVRLDALIQPAHILHITSSAS